MLNHYTEIILGLTIGIMTMAKALTGIEDLNGEVDLDFPEPQGFDKYKDKLTSTVRFNQPSFSSFDKKYLGLKMVNADQLQAKLRSINETIVSFR